MEVATVNNNTEVSLFIAEQDFSLIGLSTYQDNISTTDNRNNNFSLQHCDIDQSYFEFDQNEEEQLLEQERKEKSKEEKSAALEELINVVVGMYPNVESRKEAQEEISIILENYITSGNLPEYPQMGGESGEESVESGNNEGDKEGGKGWEEGVRNDSLGNSTSTVRRASDTKHFL